MAKNKAKKKKKSVYIKYTLTKSINCFIINKIFFNFSVKKIVAGPLTHQQALWPSFFVTSLCNLLLSLFDCFCWGSAHFPLQRLTLGAPWQVIWHFFFQMSVIGASKLYLHFSVKINANQRKLFCRSHHQINVNKLIKIILSVRA